MTSKNEDFTQRAALLFKYLSGQTPQEVILKEFTYEELELFLDLMKKSHVEFMEDTNVIN